jgi:hypothetical protein
MKKHLLSTSALVAAGMIAGTGTGMVAGSGTAQAQTAPASSPIQITVGGYMRQFFGYADNQDRVSAAPTGNSTVTGKPAKLVSQMDTEIWFQGKTTLSNGISVAVRVELEGNTSNDMIDESFVAVEGAFGRLEMGSTDNASNKTLISAPAATPGTMTDAGIGPFHIQTIAGKGSVDPHNTFGAMAFHDDDSAKISYYTPRFEGFQLGISYIPEQTQDRAGPAYGTSWSSSTYNRGIAAGVNFTRAFGAVNVAASLGGSQWKKPQSAATDTSTLQDPKSYGGGLQIGFAGFRVGGAYVNVKDHRLLAGSDIAGGNPSSTATLADFWAHGEAWDAGVTYTFGPAVVGFKYQNFKNRGQTAVLGDDKGDVYGLTGKYTLGPGVDVAALLYHAKVKGAGTTLANGNDADNNKSTGLVGGLLLSF